MAETMDLVAYAPLSIRDGCKEEKQLTSGP